MSLVAGATAVWAGLVLAPGFASAASTSGKGHAAVAKRPKAHARQVATMLTVSMTSAPAAHVTGKAASGSVAASSVPAKCANTGLVPSPSNLDLVDAATLCLVNKARAAQGLAPLVENRLLDEAAMLHSDDMVAADYFDHIAPDGTGPQERVLATGYSPGAAGGEIAENIAAATAADSTPAATVAMWMGSAGHRTNILSPDFTKTGIGATNTVPGLLGSGAGGTYTEDFA
jgi:uncharacterized protein YkwD